MARMQAGDGVSHQKFVEMIVLKHLHEFEDAEQNDRLNEDGFGRKVIRLCPKNSYNGNSH